MRKIAVTAFLVGCAAWAQAPWWFDFFLEQKEEATQEIVTQTELPTSIVDGDGFDEVKEEVDNKAPKVYLNSEAVTTKVNMDFYKSAFGG
jgi:hypothetical protein